MLNLDFLRFVASAEYRRAYSIEYFLPRDTARRGRAYQGHDVIRRPVLRDFRLCDCLRVSWQVGTFATYATFMQRRVGRLLPLQLAHTAVSIAIWGGVAAPGQAANHMPSFDLRCIAQTSVFLHAIVSCGNGVSFNGVSW